MYFFSRRHVHAMPDMVDARVSVFYYFFRLFTKHTFKANRYLYINDLGIPHSEYVGELAWESNTGRLCRERGCVFGCYREVSPC